MQLNPNGDFVEYLLTAEEHSAGMCFSPESRAVIQNLKAKAAMEIVTYIVSPITGTEQDRLLQAKLQGQVEILSYLLDGNSADTSSSED